MCQTSYLKYVFHFSCFCWSSIHVCAYKRSRCPTCPLLTPASVPSSPPPLSPSAPHAAAALLPGGCQTKSAAREMILFFLAHEIHSARIVGSITTGVERQTPARARRGPQTRSQGCAARRHVHSGGDRPNLSPRRGVTGTENPDDGRDRPAAMPGSGF